MSGRVVVLCGGVGGAKLALGLKHACGKGAVTVIGNTGDDFTHLGLAISPDLDTLLYTLSGRANAELGWGRADETWSFMGAVGSLGGEDWFRLGDGDLALHVLRSERLRAGEPLSAIMADYAEKWEVGEQLLPATDDPLATMLTTDAGELAFQDYFVRRRCVPRVTSIRFKGAEGARPAPAVLEAIADPGLRAIVIAPSNPFLSIDPILAVPGIADALRAAPAPVVAVSPLVGGGAVKGPTAKLMRELGVPQSARGVAAYYGDLLDAMLVDERDPRDELPIATARTNTLMVTLEDRIRVAQEALRLADRCP